MPLATNSAKVTAINRGLLEMMAVHNRPFRIVEDCMMLFVFHSLCSGFICPGVDFFRTTQLDECVFWATQTIIGEISKQPFLHVTSDIWTCKYTGTSMLSLTLHWFCIRLWKFTKVVVCNIPLKGRHVNENIMIGWVNGLLHWKVLKPIGRPRLLDIDVNADREEGDYVTYDPSEFSGWDRLSFCTDEGPNMVAAMRRLPDECKNNSNCVMHRCQLAVKGSCSAIVGIKNVILAGKAVVAYIKHSPPVQSALHSLQKEAGVLKPHKVKQEMPVRWDTKYDMLNSLLKLKQFLISLFELTIYQGPTISTRQWNTIQSVVKMLFPCKIFMKRGQSGGEMASKCIFLIRRLFSDLDGLSVVYKHGWFQDRIVGQTAQGA